MWIVLRGAFTYPEKGRATLSFLELKYLLDRDVRAAKRRAISAVGESNPEHRIEGASIRADEEDRDVFAVFYFNPLRPCRPSP